MQDLANKRREAQAKLRQMNWQEYNLFAKEAFAQGYKIAEFPSFYLKKYLI